MHRSDATTFSSTLNSPRITAYTIGQTTADDCSTVLSDLRNQTAAASMEVLVVAPTPGSIRNEDFDCFHSFRILEVDSVRNGGTSAAHAVREATAPFTVYAEEHATFDREWAAQLLAAHELGYDAVGFAMTNANPTTATSWAHLYGQFGPVVHPTESRESDFLAGHHVSYRRSLLLDYGEELSTVLEDESALFLDLRARGIPMYIAGEAISHHINISDFSSLVKLEFDGMRSFAGSRCLLRDWSASKRTIFALATPLIPVVRLARITRQMRRSGRLAMLPKLLPVLLPALGSGAFGEATGYLFGPGRSAERKAPVELSRHDFVAAGDRLDRDSP